MRRPWAPVPADVQANEVRLHSHLILLPTLNEEEGIRATLEELHTVARFPEGEVPTVLVIDGGSTDATLAIAREYGCVVLPQHGRGKGSAVRDGLTWAVDHGFESVGVLDADATYPTYRLPALFRLLDDGFDVVIGVRRPDHPAPTSPRNLIHRIGNGVLGYAAARFSRGPILDVCSGFWGLKTGRLPELALESTGFEIESELFVKSFRRGLRVCQVPIQYRERLGTAKLHAMRDGARIFLSILRYSGRTLPPVVPVPSVIPGAGAPSSKVFAPKLPIVSLAAILLTLDPEFVVVASTPSRRHEARALAENLPPGSYSVRVELASGNPVGRFSGPGPWSPADSAPFKLQDRPVIVSLPDRPLDLVGLGRVLVSVPGQPWIVSLDSTSPIGSSASGPAGSKARADRKRNATPFPLPGSRSILAAVIAPSWRRKERALLGANLNAVGATVLPVGSSAHSSMSRPGSGTVGAYLAELPSVQVE